MVDDLEDHDEAERGAEPPQGRLLIGVDLGHASARLAPRWLVAPGPQVQIHPAALPLDLVDLAFAVVLAGGLEGEHVQVARQVLELAKQLSYRHLLSVATSPLYVRWSAEPTAYKPKNQQASLNCLAERSSASPSSAVTAASIAREWARIASTGLTEAELWTSLNRLRR
jgi:hypothetical protein